MRIMTHNIIEENNSITMTNADASFPVANCYSNMLEEFVQSSGNSSIVTVAFNKDKVVDSIFFGYHNASSVTWVFKNSAGNVLDTVIFTNPLVNAKEYITQLTTVRSIEITMVTSELLLYFGNLACGKYTDIYNVRLPISVEYMDSSLYSQTSGGQFLYRMGFTLQSFAVDCAKLEDSQVAEFQAAWNYVHKGKTFWMDRTEEQDLQLFGAFDSNYILTRINTLTDLKFSFKEAK